MPPTHCLAQSLKEKVMKMTLERPYEKCPEGCVESSRKIRVANCPRGRGFISLHLCDILFY